MAAPAMSHPMIMMAGLDETARTAIAPAATIEPPESTIRPPWRSIARPTAGASVPETTSAALKVPKRKSSDTPSSFLIAMPSTPMA